MKFMKFIKHTKHIFLILTAVLILSVSSFHAFANADTKASSEVISMGLQNIADSFTIKVSAPAGEDILIVKDDILRALNRSDVSSITVTSLPSTEKGTLYLYEISVKVGDIIPGSDISALSFSPAGNYITNASFTFTEPSSSCEYTCKMFLLSDKNSSPLTNTGVLGSLAATFEDISIFASLTGYDPDGDDVEYIVVSYPKNGSISLDSSSGKYQYTPKSGFTGSDSFSYVICDEYGAFSTSRKVSLTVDKIDKSEIFQDMQNSSSLSEAVYLARNGIMSGSTVSGSLMFSPSSEPTRAEFIAMLMKCIGADERSNVLHTVFSDDADIPSAYKGSIANAYELGYITGTSQNGKLLLDPTSPITRADAAVIINNILSLDTSSSLPTAITDVSDCPKDTFEAVNALCNAYIMPTFDREANAHENVTREYAAKLLFNVKSFLNLTKDS